MKDLFSNLIDRMRTRELTLAPRLPARFELASAYLRDSETAAAAAAREHSRIDPAVEATPSRTAAGPVADETIRARIRDAVDASTSSPISPRGAASPPLAESMRREIRQPADAAQPAFRASGVDSPGAESPSMGPQSPRRVAPDVAQRIASALASVSQNPESGLAPSSEKLHDNGNPESIVRKTPSHDRPATVIQMSPGAPPPFQLPESPEPALARDASPVVEIRIGRIEVKAPPPASKPAPPRPSPPARVSVSLREYLNRRRR